MPTANAAFLERSCTQAELMSRQSKRTTAKAENTQTNISKLRMQTYPKVFSPPRYFSSIA